MLISTAQARAELASKKSQFRRHRFTGRSCTFSDMHFILHGRCKEPVTCGGQKREFTWQVQGIGHVVKIVAARSVSWTLPRRWQACVIRRIAFYVAGAGNPHHGSYVLRSKGSFLTGAAFLELELEDALHGQRSISYDLGYLVYLGSHGRTSETCFRNLNPLWGSCVSIAQNAGKVRFSDFQAQPSAEIVRVDHTVCWSSCVF